MVATWTGLAVMTATGDDAVRRAVYAEVDYLDGEGEAVASSRQPAIVDREGQTLAVRVPAVLEPPDAAVASMDTTLILSDNGIEGGRSGEYPLDGYDAYAIIEGNPGTYSVQFAVHGIPGETQVSFGPDPAVGTVCCRREHELIGGTSTQVKAPPDGGRGRFAAQMPTDLFPDACRAYPGYN